MLSSHFEYKVDRHSGEILEIRGFQANGLLDVSVGPEAVAQSNANDCDCDASSGERIAMVCAESRKTCERAGAEDRA